MSRNRWVITGLELVEIPASRERLSSILRELDVIKNEPEYQASTSIAEWVIAVALVVEAGLAIWDRWDKERELQKQKELQQRQEEKARREQEGHCHEPRQTGDGGLRMIL